MAGMEKETEGETLVSTRHSAPQFLLRPYRSAWYMDRNFAKDASTPS